MIAAVGLFYGTGLDAPGEFVEGEHYRVLESNIAAVEPPLKVTEFFSYGCSACADFDPQLEAWRKNLPEDVTFERVPVGFQPAWRTLAQAYHTLEQTGALERNHERLFRALHVQGRQFHTAEMLADFFDGYGVTRPEFLDAWNSSSVVRAVRASLLKTEQYKIPSVPTLAVGERYVINMGELTRPQALAAAESLLEEIRQQPQ